MYAVLMFFRGLRAILQRMRQLFKKLYRSKKFFLLFLLAPCAFGRYEWNEWGRD